MADNNVAASWKRILVLVQDINHDMKNISNYNHELESHLNALGSSFRDEGFTSIRNHIEKTRSQIDDTIPSFSQMLNKMIDNASNLKQAEDVMHQ